MEALIDRSSRMPVGGRLLVDEGALREIVTALRGLGPDRAQQITGERERIIADARAQAQRIIDQAQGQAYARVDEQKLVQLAQERARTIVAEAEHSSGVMRAEADRYVLRQMSNLEDQLQRVLREVQAGRRYLQHTTAAAGRDTTSARSAGTPSETGAAAEPEAPRSQGTPADAPATRDVAPGKEAGPPRDSGTPRDAGPTRGGTVRGS